jgi:glycosyltransferase involved in cell wall biosynthesis
MLVSLVVATKDRTTELSRFLQSVASQTYGEIEVIVVDQNVDERLRPILGAFPRLRHTYLKSKPGLSRARNKGLTAATGDVIAFPDDDCWYSPDLLEQVIGYLADQPGWGGIAGRTMGELNVRPLWRWDTQEGRVTKRNAWKRVNSNSLFLRRSVIAAGVRFDEALGVGAGTPWGSAEEVDLVVSALQRGETIQFLPQLVVFHANAFPAGSDIDLEKAYRYACGMGFVLRKHHYPADLITLEVLRPALNAIRSFFLGDFYKARFMAAMARGRIRGLLQSE